jgi:thiamine biosynthesis lipoprotein
MKTARTLAASTLILALLLACGLGLSGCSVPDEYTKYTYQFYGTFDTLVQFVGYARSQAEFDGYAKKGEARFVELNRLFDVYNGYEGLANAKTVNDRAGIAPVAVAKELVDLIAMAKEWYGKTGGKCSIALGPVTSVWKKYRDRANEDPAFAQVPPMAELQEAAGHCDLSKVVVDRAAGTVYLAEKGMALDLGAVAKGYACEIVANEFEAMGLASVIVDGGGNIRLMGRPLDGLRKRWGVGIQNPDGDAQNPSDTPLDIVFLHDTSFVTSGDYQRFYTVEGKRYCHLVDPVTLMPATYFRAVAVSYPDSGIADFMSTTLFLMPYEQGRALAESIPSLEAVWILDGNAMKMTDGMKQAMKGAGGASSAME